MENSKVSPANLVILIAGAVTLVASFLAFYKVNLGPRIDLGDLGSVGGGSSSTSAWGSGLFLIATLPAIYGLLMALHVALTSFAQVSLPERVLGLSWNQIHLALGVQAALMMICFLIVDKGGADFGIGFWLMLLGSIALVVGAVMRDRESATA